MHELKADIRNKEILFKLKREIYFLLFRQIQSLKEQVSRISIFTSLRASYGDDFNFVTCRTLLVFKRVCSKFLELRNLTDRNKNWKKKIQHQIQQHSNFKTKSSPWLYAPQKHYDSFLLKFRAAHVRFAG